MLVQAPDGRLVSVQLPAHAAPGKSIQVSAETEPDDAYAWMDFSCIDQDIPAEELQSYHNSKIRGINSLPVYIYLCSSFVTIDHPEYASRAWCRCVPHSPFANPSQLNRLTRVCLARRLEMYFAKCFELRRRVAEAGAGLTTAARHKYNKQAKAPAKARPGARLDDDPRDGELTCASDLPFIKFLHFVGEMIVGDRDKEKLQAMKKAKEGGGPRAAFARSDVW